MSFGVVYLAVNKINMKVYVGQTTVGLKTRLTWHLAEMRGGTKYAFHKALKKYGIDSFEFSIVADSESKDELDVLERIWILLLRSYEPSSGYNETFGGEGGKLTLSARQKISAAKKGVLHGDKWNLKVSQSLKGRVISDEWAQKIGEGTKRKFLDPEYRKKHSQGLIAYYLSPNPESQLQKSTKISLALTGRKQSEQHRKNQSLVRLGKKKGPMSAETKEKISRARLAFWERKKGGACQNQNV